MLSPLAKARSPAVSYDPGAAAPHPFYINNAFAYVRPPLFMASQRQVAELRKRQILLDFQKKISSLNLGPEKTPPPSLQPQPDSPETNTGPEEADVLVSTTTPIQGDASMQLDAARRIEAEAHRGLELETIKEKIAIGNRRGLNILNELAEQKVEIDKLKKDSEKVQFLEKQVEGLNAQILNLDAQVSSLKVLSDYKVLRNRFISTFKRDKLNTANERDHRIIQKGNQSVHGGDVKVDAELYIDGGRRDQSAFEALYGLDVFRVRNITDPLAIAIVNMHASVVASKYKRFSPVFQEKFSDFITELKAVSECRDPLIDFAAPPTNLTEAYLEFQQALKTEVNEVEEED